VIPGVDVSHHQGAIDWPAVAASGWAFAVIKATEGTGYVDPALAANRAGARAAGLVVGLYHFARAGDPVAEANYFASTVGALSAGEFIALDWEVQAANPVAWCKAWLDRATACLGPRPLIYLNQSTMASYDWAPVAADSGLWEAKYDGSPSAPVTAHWAFAAMKQYGSTGSVPGIGGPCDVDEFYGTAAQLRAYGAAGIAPTPPRRRRPPPRRRRSTSGAGGRTPATPARCSLTSSGGPTAATRPTPRSARRRSTARRPLPSSPSSAGARAWPATGRTSAPRRPRCCTPLAFAGERQHGRPRPHGHRPGHRRADRGQGGGDPALAGPALDLARLPNEYVPRREAERRLDELTLDLAAERLARESAITGPDRGPRARASRAPCHPPRRLDPVAVGSGISLLGVLSGIYLHFH
jgi:GH25 family lysozyme M1 (1,4-beta-N-acetylmuramidase)